MAVARQVRRRSPKPFYVGALPTRHATFDVGSPDIRSLTSVMSDEVESNVLSATMDIVRLIRSGVPLSSETRRLLASTTELLVEIREASSGDWQAWIQERAEGWTEQVDRTILELQKEI